MKTTEWRRRRRELLEKIKKEARDLSEAADKLAEIETEIMETEGYTYPDEIVEEIEEENNDDE